MNNFFFRQDDVELSGHILSATPGQSFFTQSTEPLTFTLVVKLDAGQQGFLTTRNGAVNVGSLIFATVSLSRSLPPQFDTFTFFGAMLGLAGQRARIIGTLVDNDFTSQTEVNSILAIIVEHPLALYDINTWAVAVRDLDVFTFAHDRLPLLGEPSETHVGGNRTVHLTLPAPKRPTPLATPFFREYKDDRVNFGQSPAFGAPRQLSNGDFVVDVDILTGPPESGQGFYFAHVGLTYEENYLDSVCPMGRCEDEQHHCRAMNMTRYSWVTPRVPEAKAGHLVLSPGDGKGLVSGIVAALSPRQVYDHMGMFLDNGWTIRHCTSSQDRFEDSDLWTGSINVNLGGVINEHQKVPLSGLRPDHVRFGWPGSITQSVDEVFYTGRNSLNAAWLWGTIHGTDVVDPEASSEPKPPFRIYHLSPVNRAKRVAFIDPEPSTRTDLIVRLQDTPVTLLFGNPPTPTPFVPMLVRPHDELASMADPVLAKVADEARHLSAHYRFFGYTNSAIAVDPSFVAPAVETPFWENLPVGASWAAGTIPAMCSSFVWAAVQNINPKLTRKIQLEDRFDPEDATIGREYGVSDGTYRYDEAERTKAASILFGKLSSKIAGIINGKVSGVKGDILAVLSQSTLAALSAVPTLIANQVCNSFALDKSDEIAVPLWQHPGVGDAVSPDNILAFWDLKPSGRPIKMPLENVAVYGETRPLAITPGHWRAVQLFRKATQAIPTGNLIFDVSLRAVEQENATVQIDYGCISLRSNPPRQIVFLEEGIHVIDAWELLPDPNTGELVLFRSSPSAQEFRIVGGQSTIIRLELQPPPDLWRILDVHLQASIHDRSFWGGDADARDFDNSDKPWGFELRDDLLDDPNAPADQRNSKLNEQQEWRTEPEVGSGVHVTVNVTGHLKSDKTITCHVVVSLVDSEQGETDQTEVRDITVMPDVPEIEVLKDYDFASNEIVPERARVSLWLRNRRRPT